MSFLSTANDQSPLLARQARLATALVSSDVDALALNPGPSLTYLTGLHFHLSERPVVVFLVPHEPPIIVLPQLETAKVEELPFSVQAFPYGEDPAGWQAVFRQAAEAANLSDRKVGIEPTRLRVLELRLLEAAAPRAILSSAADILASLRMIKDEKEVAAMRQAVDIAQRALLATLPLVKTGMAERELATELTLQIFHAGSDPELPFFPIVSSGPNSANPHAAPSPRPLAPGDLLVIDWGASCEGYFSDLTRTFAVGKVEPELEQIARIVKEANTAGRAAVRPGALAGDVDQAARRVIEQSGFGQYFIHRTGHGLGLEGHEEPYMRSGNPLPLVKGMTFTVEPGIYLPGRNGVRIEDDVIVTEDGGETLSDLERDLIVVG